MKKTLTLLVAVAAIAAFAGSASAVTCTLDTRPAATLLLPYFQVAMNDDGTPTTGVGAIDTIVNIVNASSANTVAHLVVWNRASQPVLDINIPFTGFDTYTFFMSGLLSGRLPLNGAAVDASPNGDGEVCQKLTHSGSSNADLEWKWNGGSGFLRFIPSRPTTTFDNTSAATLYDDGNGPGSLFEGPIAQEFIAELDGDNDCSSPESGSPNGEAAIGYVTIDMVNYCNLSDPTAAKYYDNDAIGFENNFWGDYIITTGTDIPTYAANLVAIEADPSLNGFEEESNVVTRTFYARYWEDPFSGNFADTGNTSGNGDENGYLSSTLIGFVPGHYIDNTFGDWREPLSARWGVRYADRSALSTYLRVWRASAGDTTDLCGSSDHEPFPNVTVWDEDENSLKQGGCQISPCPKQPVFDFPWETQRCNTSDGSGSPNDLTFCTGIGGAPTGIVPADQGGWIFVDFITTNADQGNDGVESTVLDQAWMGFDIGTAVQFVNVGVDGTQLDPNTCYPVHDQDVNLDFNGPEIPVYVGLGY